MQIYSRQIMMLILTIALEVHFSPLKHLNHSSVTVEIPSQLLIAIKVPRNAVVNQHMEKKGALNTRSWPETSPDLFWLS